MNDTVLTLSRALHFAAQKHTDQRRKGHRAEPYVNHVIEVAALLAEATGGGDPVLVTAGLLHDTVEDTDTTAEEVAAAFGSEVAAIVLEVTDDRHLPKAERKRLQVVTAPGKSVRAKMLRIADKISNLRSMAASPPADWSRERRQEFYDWARAVVAGCRGVNADLERLFDEAYAAGVAELREAPPTS